MNRAEAARARWARIIQEQRESGMTVARFCAERGIASSSFFPWKRRLAEEREAGGVGSTTTTAFVEAKVQGAEDARRGAGGVEVGGGIVIEIVGGRRVTVRRGFDRALLLEVIAALEPAGGSS